MSGRRTRERGHALVVTRDARVHQVTRGEVRMLPGAVVVMVTHSRHSLSLTHYTPREPENFLKAISRLLKPSLSSATLVFS